MRALVTLTVLLEVAAPALARGEPAAAPDAAPASKDWEFMLAPYGWFPGLKGTVEADGVSADIDVQFSDIWDVLDFGALGAFEARKDRLSLTTNVIYTKLSADVDQPVGPGLGAFPPGSLKVDDVTQSLIFEGRAAWDVLTLPLFGGTDERQLALDLGPAFRVWWLDNDIDVKLKPGVPLGPFKTSVDESTDWVDFLIGGRLRARLSQKIGLVVSGDYGGFSIGSSSNYTWSIAGFASYQLFEHWDVTAGWRTIKIDRDFGDLRLEGPLLGVVYRF
jgi:hypothetical protein